MTLNQANSFIIVIKDAAVFIVLYNHLQKSSVCLKQAIAVYLTVSLFLRKAQKNSNAPHSWMAVNKTLLFFWLRICSMKTKLPILICNSNLKPSINLSVHKPLVCKYTDLWTGNIYKCDSWKSLFSDGHPAFSIYPKVSGAKGCFKIVAVYIHTGLWRKILLTGPLNQVFSSSLFCLNVYVRLSRREFGMPLLLVSLSTVFDWAKMVGKGNTNTPVICFSVGGATGVRPLQ